MKSAKAVRASYEDGMGDYQACAQGNIATARGTRKAHNRMMEQRALGGTNNLLRAMFGDEDPSKPRKMCRIVTRDIDTHVWNNGVMVRTETRPVVAHTTVLTCESIPTGTLIRRAERLEMGVLAYCNLIGYLPSDDQLVELLEVD